MNYFHTYIYLIIFIKVIFVLLSISHILLNVKGQKESKLDKNIVYWKERCEFIFILLMSLLLIYLFNPRHNRNMVIDNETKILLYLFGLILIITADWGVFFKEAKWFKQLQGIIGDK